MKGRYILGIILAGALWVVITRLTAIRGFVHVLTSGNYWWLALALVLQVFYFLTYAALFRSTFALVGIKTKLVPLISTIFSAITIGVVVPSGGISSTASMAYDVTKGKQSLSKAFIGAILGQGIELASFAVVLVVGLLFLLTDHLLTPAEIFAALLLFLLITAIISMVFLSLWLPRLSLGVLSFLESIYNFFARLTIPNSPEKKWAAKAHEDFILAANTIKDNPRRIRESFIIALAAHVINIASLYTIFLAFNQPIMGRLLIAAYAIAILFLIVSITPQGIGIVEGAMILMLTSAGIPSANAVAVAFAFRGFSFWIPFIAGLLSLQPIKSHLVAIRDELTDFATTLMAPTKNGNSKTLF